MVNGQKLAESWRKAGEKLAAFPAITQQYIFRISYYKIFL